MPEQHQQRSHGHHARGHRLGDQVAGHLRPPGHPVGRRVGGTGHHAGGAGLRGGVLLGGVGPDHPVVGDGRAQRVERRRIGPQVVHLRQGSLLGRPHRGVAPGDEPGGLVVGVVEVGHFDGMGRADHHAARLETLLDAVIAEVALVGGIGRRVDVDGVVGAGVHAPLAADAVLVAEVHDAVRCPEQGTGGADVDARRVVAVVAAHHREMPVDIGERARLDVLDPGPVHTEGDVVLALARHRAGVTADAALAVEQEAEPGHRTPSVLAAELRESR